MTDYSWELQERSEQKSLFESHRRDRELYGSDEERIRRLELKQKKVIGEFIQSRRNFLISQIPLFRAMKSNTEPEDIT